MAITITNLNPDLTMPLIESIDAQTMFMEDNAACQAAGISSIYNTPLCGGSGTTAQDIAPVSEPCCRMETLDDTPGPGDTTVRETCDNGQITDVVTFADGQECTFNRRSADPTSTNVVFDENCQEAVSDVTTSCKIRALGEPYDRYFIPLASDFGNQVYCVEGSTYAFAWSGVMNATIKEFLASTSGIDLEDPTNQYVAVVGGGPYVCGQDPAGTQQNAVTWVAGQDANGDDYYCFPFLDANAHTTNDPLALSAATVAYDNMGDPIPCPAYIYDGLQITQQAKLEGCFSPILSICDAWDGKAEEVEPDEPDEDGGLNLNPLCASVEVPEVAGKTFNESYVMLWQDYWRCEKKNKTLRNALLAVQGASALAGLVSAIQTYNKILDKQLDVLCDVRDDVGLLKLCNAAMLGDGTAENPGILKECQANLLANHNDRIGTINSRGQAFCDFADDEIDCYEQLWRPIVKKEAPTMASELHTMLHNGKLSSEYTSSWADGLQSCVTENMLPELKRQFGPLMSSVNCTSNNLNAWREELKRDADDLQDHFNKVYKPGEVKMIPAMMDMSACMVQRVCELRDWLYDCAEATECVYKEGYQQGEIPQARAAMANAAQLIPKVVDSVRWLETNIPAATEIFRCYKEGIDTINPRLFANAGDLAQEIQGCYQEFRDMSHEARERYRKVYKKREFQLVHAQMDFAIKLVCQVEDSLNRLDNWSQQDRVMYENFRDAEIKSSLDLVLNGQSASNDTHEFGDWWDERTKEFHDTYHDNWLPCDIENLKQHCDMWSQVNPLREIHRNADDMQHMSVQATELYEKGLIHAESYLDEVFKDADKFDFCVEDASVHHIRRRIDQALDELERCTPKYSTGFKEHQKMQLKAGGARAEGAAYASAARWKWWANEQLGQQDHDRRVALLGVMDSVAARGLAGNGASTAAHDTLLSHMREAITRGALYTGNMQDAGRTTTSLKGNEVDAMLRMVQLWHFWPELAASQNGQFNQSVHTVHNQARDLVQLGHFWPGQASQDKRQAANIAESAIATGVQLSQIGQYYLTQADAMNDARATMANQSGQLGNQFAQTGHNLHRLASDKMGNALQQSIAGAGPGIQAGQLGAQHMGTALEIENRMTLNALEHLKAGISSMALGVDFLSEVRQTQQLAGSYGIPAATQLLNLFETGRRQSILAMEANQQCKQVEFDMLCKAKDFVMNNYQVTTNALHAGTAGTLNAGNNLLQQQGNNAAGAFGLLGNSLEGLINNNTGFGPPPFPGSGPSFSAGGGGGGFY